MVDRQEISSEISDATKTIEPKTKKKKIAPMKHKCSKLNCNACFTHNWQLDQHEIQIHKDFNWPSKNKIDYLDIDESIDPIEGGQGNVYFGAYNQRHCAIKILPKSEDACHEIEVLLSVQDVMWQLKMYDYFTHEGNVYIILERCAMDLSDFLVIQKYSCNFRLQLYLCITKCVVELHNVGIAHRDLKEENFLVSYNGGIKLADYGHSIFLPADRRCTLTVNSIVGTDGCQAPELKTIGGEYNGKVDVFSIGKIIEATEEAYEKMDNDLHFIVAKATESDPTERLSIDELNLWLLNNLKANSYNFIDRSSLKCGTNTNNTATTAITNIAGGIKNE
jgi:serine/threonine protein kinase